MRRQALKDLMGTLIAFAVLAFLTFVVIFGEYALDLFKAHKAG
ncbi:MAG TPA: hypothetical protein VET65_07210 [Candidatus Limnocylindrales bacterium]|nr:hypothetical protein [Candidatus Limnocylindrales bacterium]